MFQIVKRLAGRIVPAPCRQLLRNLQFKCKYGGTKFKCIFCGGHFRKLLPEGLKFSVLTENRVVGGGYRVNATCPCCYSFDRERLIYLYLKEKTNVFSERLKMLHVAPELNLQKVLKARPNIDYVSADLDPKAVMVQMDITNIQYEKDCFDVIICNHVLEHIPNDRRAMSELYRILKPGGWSILQVPISLSLRETYEDRTVDTPAERERLFGQGDHVRIYAHDYKERLESVGFAVEVISPSKEFSTAEVQKHALLEGEKIYLCSKLDSVVPSVPRLPRS